MGYIDLRLVHLGILHTIHGREARFVVLFLVCYTP